MKPGVTAQLEAELRELAALLGQASASLERVADLVREATTGAEESAGDATASSCHETIQPGLECAPEPVEEELAISDEVQNLSQELDALEGYVRTLSWERSTAQICAWAGRAREIQDRLRTRGAPAEAMARLRRLFGQLTGIRKDVGCGWVDALTPSWTADDWEAYIEWHEAIASGAEPELTPEQERFLYRSLLRGLLIPLRRVSGSDAAALITDARAVLEESDPALVDAVRWFGEPSRAAPSPRPTPLPRRKRQNVVPPEAPPRAVSSEALAITRGRRAILVGGQGARENHRQAIQDALEFGELEWVTSERGQASVFTRLTDRAQPGRYDLVLYLAAFTSHKAGGFIRACKQAGIPIVYLPRGYSVASVERSILDQLHPAP